MRRVPSCGSPGVGRAHQSVHARRPPATTGRRLLDAAVLAAGGASVVLLVAPGVGASARGSAATVNLSVVDIVTNLAYQNAGAAGTGIVLTSTGEVLTNNHVIRGAATIKVTDVGNHRTYPATVVGYDVSADIAVLQLKGASGLKTAAIGNSTTVKVGQSVTATGNAGGTGGTPTATTGTVTALNRTIVASDGSGSERLTGLIETDAVLQPGDSGGPLTNAAGRVIGIDTAASSTFTFQSGSSEGFAIPINRAVALARQITAKKASATVHIGPTAFLGVDVVPSGYYRGQQFTAGAYVLEVIPASPAEKAGIVGGDVLNSLNGRTIASSTALTNLLLTMKPRATVTLGWVDQAGARHSGSLMLASGPPQ
ncbi:MAG TPA: trypsin-like peptidase domain-containing protein [Acidimicrobiales bacterium]|nr:trypsin-like peptidase domain-containing protein [Acidimicrobiales bacterium]